MRFARGCDGVADGMTAASMTTAIRYLNPWRPRSQFWSRQTEDLGKSHRDRSAQGDACRYQPSFAAMTGCNVVAMIVSSATVG